MVTADGMAGDTRECVDRSCRSVPRLDSLLYRLRSSFSILASCAAVETVNSTKCTLPPRDSTAARARSTKSPGTVGSGANVKMSDLPASAAASKAEIQ
jgi:hypothetical protein